MDIFQVQTDIRFFKSLLSDSSLSSITLLLSGLLYLAHSAFVEEGIWFRIYIPLAYICHSVRISRSETITKQKKRLRFLLFPGLPIIRSPCRGELGWWCFVISQITRASHFCGIPICQRAAAAAAALIDIWLQWHFSIWHSLSLPFPLPLPLSLKQQP